MQNEFDRIMEYLSMSPEDRAIHLEEVLEDSVEFFERFKHVMEKGTPEEKQQIIERVRQMQTRIQSETKRICETTGMTEEEIKSFAENASNFSEDHWEIIKSTKDKIEKESQEIEKLLKGKEEAKPKKKGKKKPKDWLRS